MGRWVSLTVWGILLATAGWCAGAEEAPDGRRWWSHVAYLADDALEGRDTGSPRHRRAAEYTAGEFEADGGGPFPPRPGPRRRRGAAQARRRRRHLAPGRSLALPRSPARLRRLRVVHPGNGPRRFPGPGR